jgi:thiamine biosynthesis lipoprotein
MIREDFAAMGTTVTVIAAAPAGAAATRALFAVLERRLSRFLPSSELSHINRSAAPTLSVSSTMARLLARAAELRERTGGLVDPAVGGAVAAWGYDCTFGIIRDLEDQPAQLPTASEWWVSGRTLRRAPGTVLDLGGIAKGWAADVAVESGRALLVSAGGDVRSVMDDVTVEIMDPWADTVAAPVHLRCGGLATSSVSRRRWVAGGLPVNHIIDPRTSRPSDSPVVSASAVCATAAEAEAAAKAVLLHGAAGLAWADRRPWIEAALATWHDGSVYATTGWEMAA